MSGEKEAHKIASRDEFVASRTQHLAVSAFLEDPTDENLNALQDAHKDYLERTEVRIRAWEAYKESDEYTGIRFEKGTTTLKPVAGTFVPRPHEPEPAKDAESLLSRWMTKYRRKSDE